MDFTQDFSPETQHQTSGFKVQRLLGCDDKGKEYEIKITALIALRCAFASQVEDFWIGSNVNHVGDFDDIVLCIKFQCGEYVTFLIQLKHQENPQKITRSSFTIRVDEGKKKNVKEDFSLYKYSKSYVSIVEGLKQAGRIGEDIVDCMKKCDRIYFVIFTNRPIGEYDILKPNDHEYFEFLNTSTKKNDTNLFDNRLLNFDKNFLENLVLFSGQINTTGVSKLVLDEIKKFFRNLKLNFETIVNEVFSFVEWKSNNVNKVTKKIDTINKSEIMTQIVAEILKPFMFEFKDDVLLKNDSILETNLWNDLIQDHNFILVDNDNSYVIQFLMKYISGLVSANFDNKYTLWKDHIILNGEEKLDLNKYIFSQNDISIFSVYQSLWFENKVPLLITISNVQEFQTISKIFELSKCNLKLIVLKPPDITIQSNKKTLISLNDLSQSNVNTVLDKRIKIQGKSSDSLRSLVTKSYFKHIKCHDIIEIITSSFNVGFYLRQTQEFYIQQHLIDESCNTISQLKSTISNQVINLLSGISGMGKTLFLDYLSTMINDDFWIIRINLGQHDDIFDQYSSLTSAKCILEHFYRVSIEESDCKMNEELSRLIFEQKYVKHKKLLVLIDEFDEVAAYFKNEVVEMIRTLKDEGCCIWASVRPAAEDFLKGSFKCKTYRLSELNEKNQREYLIARYSKFHERTKSEEYVRNFFRWSKEMTSDRKLILTQIPLHLYVCADIFKTGFLRSVDKNRPKTNFNLLKLMEELVAKRSQILEIKFGSDSKRIQTLALQIQKMCALRWIFPPNLLTKLEIDNALLNYFKVAENVHFLQRDGLLLVEENPKNVNLKYDFKFIHPMFAYFFAAQWISENFNSSHQHIKFVAQRLIKCRFENFPSLIFRLLDLILCKGNKVHTNVLRRKHETRVIQQYKNLDLGGRCILHNLSSAYTECLNSKLLVNPQTIIYVEKTPLDLFNTKDFLMNYGILDYALKNCQLAFADNICQQTNVTTKIKLSRQQRSCYLISCVIFNFRYLFKSILLNQLSRNVLLEDLSDIKLNIYCNIPVQFQNDNYFKYLNEIGFKNVFDMFKFTEEPYKKYYRDRRFAVSFGTLENITFVLSNHPIHIDNEDEYGNTLLYYSAKFGRSEIVNFIISEGANLNKRCRKGNTPLHIASLKGHTEVVKLLIENGCQVDAFNDLEQIPLSLALEKNNSEIVDLLTQKNVRLDLIDSDKNTLLHYCARAQKSCRKFIGRFIVIHPEMVNLKNCDEETALDVAIRRGNFECVSALLENKDDSVLTNNTVLHEAILSDQILVEQFEIMLNLRRDLTDCRNDRGETPFLLACKMKREDFSTLLFDKGANFEIEDFQNCGSFYQIIKNGWIELFDRIIKSSKLARVQINSGISVAVLYNRVIIFDKLIKICDDFNVKDSFGNTCLHYATQSENQEFTRKLIETGQVDITVINIFKRSPIHYAAISGKYSDVSLLLQEGIDWKLKDVYEKTCLEYAIELNFQSIVSLFSQPEIDVKLNEQTAAKNVSKVDEMVLTAFQEKTNINGNKNIKEIKSSKRNFLILLIYEYIKALNDTKS